VKGEYKVMNKDRELDKENKGKCDKDGEGN
jgi:hypothetical protein